jgi:hypothetical protein
MQDLKSASFVRVDSGKALHLYAAARNSSNDAVSLMCPAGAQRLHHDVYGRPASQNTLSVNLDAACGMGTQFPAQRHIQIENNNRPYLPVASAGMRGAADLMGRGRDMMPQDLYGEGSRGNFARIYNTKNNAPWEPPVQYPYMYSRIEQPFDYSHDASRSVRPGH